jgi:hypothetical protein
MAHPPFALADGAHCKGPGSGSGRRNVPARLVPPHRRQTALSTQLPTPARDLASCGQGLAPNPHRQSCCRKLTPGAKGVWTIYVGRLLLPARDCPARIRQSLCSSAVAPSPITNLGDGYCQDCPNQLGGRHLDSYLASRCASCCDTRQVLAQRSGPSATTPPAPHFFETKSSRKDAKAPRSHILLLGAFASLRELFVVSKLSVGPCDGY